jgi:MFS transporter, ACS family, solute carrier family 17 (sodium-dependent inorganic phosphate cotransporter), other
MIVNSTPAAAVTNQTIAAVVGLLSVTFGMAAFIRTGLFCGHQDLSPKYASIMLGVTNTAAAIASTLSTFFTGYFLSKTGGNWAYSLFFPIAVLQIVSVFVFLVWKSDPVDFDKAKTA